MRQALPSAFGVRWRRSHKLLDVTLSLILLAGMLAILALCAWTVWGAQSVLWALLAGGASLLLTPAVAPEWIMRMYRAVPVGPRDLPSPPRLFYCPARCSMRSRSATATAPRSPSPTASCGR